MYVNQYSGETHLNLMIISIYINDANTITIHSLTYIRNRKHSALPYHHENRKYHLIL